MGQFQSTGDNTFELHPGGCTNPDGDKEFDHEEARRQMLLAQDPIVLAQLVQLLSDPNHPDMQMILAHNPGLKELMENPANAEHKKSFIKNFANPGNLKNLLGTLTNEMGKKQSTNDQQFAAGVPIATCYDHDKYIALISSCQVANESLTAFSTLLKIYNNIVNFPAEEKYRSIPLDGKLFTEKLGSATAICQSLLMSTGFAIDEPGGKKLVYRGDVVALKQIVVKLEAAEKACLTPPSKAGTKSASASPPHSYSFPQHYSSGGDKMNFNIENMQNFIMNSATGTPTEDAIGQFMLQVFPTEQINMLKKAFPDLDLKTGKLSEATIQNAVKKVRKVMVEIGLDFIDMEGIEKFMRKHLPKSVKAKAFVPEDLQKLERMVIEGLGNSRESHEVQLVLAFSANNVQMEICKFFMDVEAKHKETIKAQFFQKMPREELEKVKDVPMIEHKLQLAKSQFGDFHIKTLSYTRDLARAYFLRDIWSLNVDKAVSLFEDCYSKYVIVYGESSNATLSLAEELADVIFAADQFETQHAFMNVNDPLFIKSLKERSEKGSKKQKEALSVIDNCILYRRRLLGDNHRDTSASITARNRIEQQIQKGKDELKMVLRLADDRFKEFSNRMKIHSPESDDSSSEMLKSFQLETEDADASSDSDQMIDQAIQSVLNRGASEGNKALVYFRSILIKINESPDIREYTEISIESQTFKSHLSDHLKFGISDLFRLAGFQQPYDVNYDEDSPLASAVMSMKNVFFDFIDIESKNKMRKSSYVWLGNTRAICTVLRRLDVFVGVCTDVDVDDESVALESSALLPNDLDIEKRGVNIDLFVAVKALALEINPDEKFWTIERISAYVVGNHEILKPNCRHVGVNVESTLTYTSSEADRYSLIEGLHRHHFDDHKRHPRLNLSYEGAAGSVATIFLSFAYKDNYVELVNALERFLKDNNQQFNRNSTYFWFDLFINNQWQAASKGYYWWAYTFRKVIEEIGHTVCFVSSWSKPLIFTRVWCLFEISCSPKLSLALSDEEISNFQRAVRMNEDALRRYDIDLSAATSFNVDDRDKIFSAVSKMKGGGVLGCNNRVTKLVQAWMTAAATKMIEYDVDDEDISEVIAFEMYMTARILSIQGKFADAKVLWMRVVRALERKKGPKDVDTLGAKVGLASALVNLHEIPEATSLINHTIQELELAVGSSHSNTFSAKSVLSAIYKKEKQFRKAQDLLEELLRDQEAVLESSDPNLCNTLLKLGNCLFSQSKFDQAETFFNRAIRGFEISKGPEDPSSTLNAISQLADLYYRQNNINKAKKLCDRILPIQERLLGLDHEDTKFTSSIRSRIEALMGDFGDSILLYQRQLQGKNLEDPANFDKIIAYSRILMRQTNYQEAYRLLESARVIVVKACMDANPFSVTTSGLGCIDDMGGKQTDLLRTAISHSIRFSNALGELFICADRYWEAGNTLLHSLGEAINIFGEDYPDVLIAQRMLIKVLTFLEPSKPLTHPEAAINSLNSIDSFGGLAKEVQSLFNNLASADPLLAEHLRVKKEASFARNSESRSSTTISGLGIAPVSSPRSEGVVADLGPDPDLENADNIEKASRLSDLSFQSFEESATILKRFDWIYEVAANFVADGGDVSLLPPPSTTTSSNTNHGADSTNLPSEFDEEDAKSDMERMILSECRANALRNKDRCGFIGTIGNCDAATKIFDEVCPRFERVFGADDIEFASLLKTYGACLLAHRSDLSEAKTLLERSHGLLSKLLGADNCLTLEVKESLRTLACKELS